MATKSILTNVTIRDRSSAKKLVRALEQAENHSPNQKAIGKITKKCEAVDVSKIRSIFGEK